MKKSRFTIAALAAGVIWGTMGYFRNILTEYGIGSADLIIVRCSVASLMFGLSMLIKDPKKFKVKKNDIWVLVSDGVVSELLFTYCYFQAMSLTGLSTAAVLLYTAPAFVLFMSVFIFKEKITIPKVIALVLSFAGCALVSGIGTDTAATPLGITFGILSGLLYATYNIFTSLAIKRGYDSLTVNFYANGLAFIGAGLYSGFRVFKIMFSSVETFIPFALTGIVTCFLPYLLYSYSLSGLENSKASILTSVEPVVATIIAVLVFSEEMTIMKAVGIVLVLLAVVILSSPKKKQD